MCVCVEVSVLKCLAHPLEEIRLAQKFHLMRSKMTHEQSFDLTAARMSSQNNMPLRHMYRECHEPHSSNSFHLTP